MERVIRKGAVRELKMEIRTLEDVDRASHHARAKRNGMTKVDAFIPTLKVWAIRHGEESIIAYFFKGLVSESVCGFVR